MQIFIHINLIFHCGYTHMMSQSIYGRLPAKLNIVQLKWLEISK